MRFCVAILCGLLLSGCTDADWDRTLTYAGVGASDQPAAPPERTVAAATVAPVPASAPADNSFCEAVAKQDAGGNDFDIATQQRVFARSFQQCVAMFGDAIR
jgi:hypothetical protein